MKPFVVPDIDILAFQAEDVLVDISGIETPGDGDWLNANSI